MTERGSFLEPEGLSRDTALAEGSRICVSAMVAGGQPIPPSLFWITSPTARILRSQAAHLCHFARRQAVGRLLLYRLSAPRGKPVIDLVKPIMDAWLKEDHAKPRKQRHSAQRIYERLRDEHGFAGSDGT